MKFVFALQEKWSNHNEARFITSAEHEVRDLRRLGMSQS